MCYFIRVIDGMDDLKDVNELANKYPEARPLINRKKKTDKEKE